MVTVSEEGYLEHKKNGKRCNWWLLGQDKPGKRGIELAICFPEEYVGKRVRFKVEVIQHGHGQ